MSAWKKVEIRKITEYREGSIFRTIHVRYEWRQFGMDDLKYQRELGNGILVCSTTDTFYGKESDLPKL